MYSAIDAILNKKKCVGVKEHRISNNAYCLWKLLRYFRYWLRKYP